MASLSATPDDLFAEYVGTGDLALRLWRGVLRITPSSLTFRLAPSHTVTGLARSLSSGLTIEQGNGVTDLIVEAEAFLSDDARLRRATRPLADDSLPTSYGAPTSLVRSLLAVDALQEGLLRSLIVAAARRLNAMSQHDLQAHCEARRIADAERRAAFSDEAVGARRSVVVARRAAMDGDKLEALQTAERTASAERRAALDGDGLEVLRTAERTAAVGRRAALYGEELEALRAARRTVAAERRAALDG